MTSIQLKSFWDSIYKDLSEEDLAKLVDDWTAHGIMLIQNIDGMPHWADPEGAFGSE
jgi:hypothetical protein